MARVSRGKGKRRRERVNITNRCMLTSFYCPFSLRLGGVTDARILRSTPFRRPGWSKDSLNLARVKRIQNKIMIIKRGIFLLVRQWPTFAFRGFPHAGLLSRSISTTSVHWFVFQRAVVFYFGGIAHSFFLPSRHQQTNWKREANNNTMEEETRTVFGGGVVKHRWG